MASRVEVLWLGALRAFVVGGLSLLSERPCAFS